jgi:hypothetical protein
VASSFSLAVLVGAGLLALSVDARFPSLAPDSLGRRFFAMIVAFVLLQAVPVFGSSVAAAYASVFGIVLPTFVVTFLTAAWLVRAVRDAR